MEDQQLVGGKIGEVGSFDVAFKEGKAMASVKIAQGPVSVDLVVAADAEKLAVAALNWVKEKIPGHFDDVAIDAAIELLLKK